MRLFKAWIEDYEIQEVNHSTSVSHIREGDGSYDGEGVSGEEHRDGKGKGKGKKGKGKGKTKSGKGGEGEIKPEKPKKEKTEEQLARAAS